MAVLRTVSAVAAACALGLSGAGADFVALEIIDITPRDDDGWFLPDARLLEMKVQFNSNDKLISVDDAVIFATSPFYHAGRPAALALTKEALGGDIDTFLTIGFEYAGPTGNPDGPDAGTVGDPNKTKFSSTIDLDQFLLGSVLDDAEHLPEVGVSWYAEPSANPNIPNVQGWALNYPGIDVLIGHFAFKEIEAECDIVWLSGSLGLTYERANGQIVQTPRIVFEQVAESGCLYFSITGDITWDSKVDGEDLGRLLAAWGGPPICPYEDPILCDSRLTCWEDLNCDGIVDALDLEILLTNWFP